MEKAKNIGMDPYMSEQAEKISILEALLKGFNDGRRKSFFCLAVNLLEVQDLRLVMDKITHTTEPDQSIKEKSATACQLFQSMAEQRNITLKLRKVTKEK